MKKLAALFALVGTLALTGCGTTPIIQKYSGGEPINGHYVSVSNYDKLNGKDWNVAFQNAPEAQLSGFPVKEWQSAVLDKLRASGVNVTPSGKPVTITLNSFKAEGSSYANHKNAQAPISGGIVNDVGGSPLLAFVANRVERADQRVRQAQPVDDGKNFVPIINFSIESAGYKTDVELESMYAMTSYHRIPIKLSAQAISEFFIPGK